MSLSNGFNTFWRRLLIATVLWVLIWPILWYFKIGDITGAKSWFRIIGELNYPIAAISFSIVNDVVEKVVKSGWKLFLI